LDGLAKGARHASARTEWKAGVASYTAACAWDTWQVQDELALTPGTLAGAVDFCRRMVSQTLTPGAPQRDGGQRQARGEVLRAPRRPRAVLGGLQRVLDDGYCPTAFSVDGGGCKVDVCRCRVDFLRRVPRGWAGAGASWTLCVGAIWWTVAGAGAWWQAHGRPGQIQGGCSVRGDCRWAHDARRWVGCCRHSVDRGTIAGRKAKFGRLMVGQHVATIGSPVDANAPLGCRRRTVSSGTPKILCVSEHVLASFHNVCPEANKMPASSWSPSDKHAPSTHPAADDLLDHDWPLWLCCASVGILGHDVHARFQEFAG
jgi:hypothetical protein